MRFISPAWSVTLFWTLLVCASPGGSADRLFHVPFDGQIDAVTAGGDPQGRYVPPKDAPATSPVFAEGVHGQALDIGNLSRVIYRPDGNVLDDRGTITFWTRRMGPAPKERYTFHLFGWTNADHTWVYIYRWEWFSGLKVLHGKGGAGDIAVPAPGSADDGQWHLFAFTWDGTHARAYLDGQTDSAGERNDFPRPRFTSLWVGTPGGGTKCSRLLDELSIFSEPLTVAELKQMVRDGLGVRTEPTLVIPKRSAPIRLDGKVTPSEWQNAVETTGFVSLQSKAAATPQTTAWLTYDAKALYVAVRSPFPREVQNNPAMTAGITGMLRQTRERFDTDVDNDDAVEINLMPSPPDGVWYRLVVNGLNTHYDYSVAPNNNISLDWNPAWESASSADSESWQVEMRIPFASLNVPPPGAGDRWGMNIGRLWQALRSGRDYWKVAAEGTPGYRYGLAPVQFGGVASPVVRLHGWGPLSDNRLAVAGELVNPGPEAIALAVRLRSDSGEIQQIRKRSVKPGGRVSFRIDRRIQEPATSLLTFEVTGAGNERVLFRSQVPVTVRQVLEITSAHFPTAGIYRVQIDAGRLRETPLSNLSLTVDLTDAEQKPVTPQVRLAPLPDYRCTTDLNVKPLPPGAYQVRCVLRREGQTVGEKVLTYRKRPLPDWYGNTIGITTDAPKPFTPIRRRDDTLEVWGRRLHFDGRLFPVRLETQGRQILQAPIELIWTDGTGTVHSSRTAPCRVTWGKHSDFRVEFTRRCRVGELPVETDCWLECDGFLWTTLVVGPANRTVRRLVVRVPLKKEWAAYINPYDYSTVKTGKLASAGYRGGASPLWLGNGTGGLQWTTETLAPCRLKPDVPPVCVRPTASATVFELTLVDVPAKLTKPMTVSWGWVLTPTRPPTPGYRGWLTGNCDLYPGYQWFWPKGTDFDPRWLGYSHFLGKKERPDGKGTCTVSAGPYIVTGLCSTSVPEYRYWGDEWSPSRLGRRSQGKQGLCSVAADSWVDYLVWCYRRTYERGRFVGLYYDCAPYYPDDNFYHGAGYREGDRLLPTNPVLGARRVAQRLYCMLRKLEPERTMILYHNSGQIDMAFLSWCDVYVDGENFTSRLNKHEQDYHRLYPPDAFLAQSRGHNFGPCVWFLDEFNRSGATTEEDWKRLGVQPVTHLYGLILLHDSGYWKAYGNPAGYKLVDDALRKYQFDDRYEMIPYWRQQIVSLPAKLFATFYRDAAGHRVLMVLLNNNDEERTLRLDMNWQALGFTDSAGIRVTGTVFALPARIESRRLVVTVGKANMRLLAFEGE